MPLITTRCAMHTPLLIQHRETTPKHFPWHDMAAQGRRVILMAMSDTLEIWTSHHDHHHNAQRRPAEWSICRQHLHYLLALWSSSHVPLLQPLYFSSGRTILETKKMREKIQHYWWLPGNQQDLCKKATDPTCVGWEP